jgi:hypothetical protein
VETISDGIIEKKTDVADSLCMADVKAIKITFRVMKNVEMRADHKHHKRSVPFPKLKAHVLETFRDGIMTTTMAFAENISTLGAREIKIDLLIRPPARSSAIKPESPLFRIMFAHFRKQRVPVGQLLFNGTSTQRPDAAKDSITADAKETPTDSTTGTRAKVRVFLRISIEILVISLKSPEIATTIEKNGIMM